MNRKIKILIVDDDRDIRESLNEYLRRFDYETRTAQNANEARGLLSSYDFDLILLDIMMPGEDGLSLCQALKSTIDTPIILLTALNDTMDQVIGLELGADDYISKPFEPRLLLARIKTVLRRGSKGMESAKQAHQFARWTYDAIQGEINHQDGSVATLSRLEMSLLSVFLKKPNVVISRDELMSLTQGRERHPLERSIDNAIARLRRKIEADPKNPRIIKTIRGGGYKFIIEADQ